MKLFFFSAVSAQCFDSGVDVERQMHVMDNVMTNAYMEATGRSYTHTFNFKVCFSNGLFSFAVQSLPCNVNGPSTSRRYVCVKLIS